MTVQLVAYYRVSTAKQGQSGLGLDAQEDAINQYLQANRGELIASYKEVESGKLDERPELTKAINHCYLTGSTLLIAKLDRLSRDAAFIANLMKSEIDFAICDLPQANKFTIHILAAVAEYEREAISARTKVALKAAKGRGIKLGNPHGDAPLRAANKGNSASLKAIRAKVDAHTERLRPAVDQLIAEHPTARKLADALNERKFKTRRGGKWHAQTVIALLDRLGFELPNKRIKREEAA